MGFTLEIAGIGCTLGPSLDEPFDFLTFITIVEALGFTVTISDPHLGSAHPDGHNFTFIIWPPAYPNGVKIDFCISREIQESGDCRRLLCSFFLIFTQVLGEFALFNC